MYVCVLVCLCLHVTVLLPLQTNHLLILQLNNFISIPIKPPHICLLYHFPSFHQSVPIESPNRTRFDGDAVQCLNETWKVAPVVVGIRGRAIRAFPARRWRVLGGSPLILLRGAYGHPDHPVLRINDRQWKGYGQRSFYLTIILCASHRRRGGYGGVIRSRCCCRDF